VAADLLPGMLPRLFWTLGLILCLTALCVALPPAARTILAAPVALLTGYITLHALVDRSFTQALMSRVRAQLRLRANPIGGK
jgi:hypothetical protein